MPEDSDLLICGEQKIRSHIRENHPKAREIFVHFRTPNNDLRITIPFVDKEEQEKCLDALKETFDILPRVKFSDIKEKIEEKLLILESLAVGYTLSQRYIGGLSDEFKKGNRLTADSAMGLLEELSGMESALKNMQSRAKLNKDVDPKASEVDSNEAVRKR